MSGVRPGGVEDRYVAPLEANRRGAHRARPNALLGILPLVAVAAVVIAVAGGVVAVVTGGGLLPRNGNTPVSGIATGAKTPAATSTKPAPSANTLTVTKTPPAVIGTTTTSAGPSPSDSAAAVDKNAKVVFLNATSPPINRLASRVSAKLKSDGWTAADYSKDPVTKQDITQIYYARSDLKATALALADRLGVGKVRVSTSRSRGSIAVHLGNDYHE